MNDQFWKNAPKLFADDASVAVMRGTGTVFLLALRSGKNAQVFTLTPEHMKRFAQLVTHEVQEYEKADGEIAVEAWVPGMKSPFSVENIKDDEEGK